MTLRPEQLSLIQQAVQVLQKQNLRDCLDPLFPNSRPHAKQWEILNDIGKYLYRWVICGNQCKPYYSQVSMADGTTKNISDVEVGDRVITFDTSKGIFVESTVIRTWNNGVKEVWRYITQDGGTTDSTPNHQMVVRDSENNYVKSRIDEVTHLIDNTLSNNLIVDKYPIGEMTVYDITVDHPDHNYLCDNLITGNSGKSSMACREIAWVLNGDHPTWTRPPEWGSDAITVLVAGQDRKMMELELWGNKLRHFFNPDDWREVRAGQSLQYVEHKTNGNRIIFVSHADSSEKNRKHMQGYVAHYVWVDEMPASIKVLEELQRRVDARRGYFLATFTPKFKNVQIKKFIETADTTLNKRYRMSKLDNPLYADRLEEELRKLSNMSEDMRNAILNGDWMSGDGLIYNYNADAHGEPIPEHYSPTEWRHMLVVDPATESKLGYSLWAEDPQSEILKVDPYRETGRRKWYCVTSGYVEGIRVPTKIIQTMEERVKGYRITHRLADSHEGWYIAQAAAMGYIYKPVERKTVEGMKSKFIATSQELMGSLIHIPSTNVEFVDELCSYERNQDTGNIIKSSKYHIIDSFHYFSGSIPEPVHEYITHDFHTRLRYTAELAEAEAEQRRRYQRGHRRQYPIGGVSSTNHVIQPLPPMRRPRRRRF